MSALREAVLLHMRLRGLSPRTHESYIYALEQLARYYWRPLDELTNHEIQAYLDYIINERKLAWATVNVYFSAYRMLYEQVLKRPSWGFSIPPRGRSGKKPGVLSLPEVLRLIETPSKIKHRALLALTYSSGLRVAEVVKVRACDIDRGRMMVFVNSGKGHKDRYTILSKQVLKLLEEHWRINHPHEYFFFGRDRSKHMSIGTAQAVYYRALKKSGVRHVGGIHVLRHCFATHLMEQGVDIYSIKKWMGHRALATTGRYMHVTSEYLATLVSPFDRVMGHRR
jgi:site-specific recombinase XerD